MKHCPSCRQDYSDDTLNYCLQDGSILMSVGDEAPTVPQFNTPHISGSGQGAAPAETPISNSIAVLPFANISADPDNEYFCDGLAEELLNALAKIDGLKVAARTSSFFFKGKNVDASSIGAALHVATVLEGSVRKSGDKLRITAQLISAADGYQIWSERYDRKLRDVFDIQEEITIAIVDSLKIKLLGEQRAEVLKRYTENAEAYQLYLRGRFYWNKRTSSGYRQAIDYFERAIELDPNYALAYSGISDCYNSSGFSFDVGALPSKDFAEKAKSAAVKALELDANLAEAHTSLAYAKQLFDWDWKGAEDGFRRALDLNPNYANAHHWYSHFLVAMSRFEESLAQSRLALELDPLSAVMGTHLGWHYLYAREYDQAIEKLRSALSLDPEFLHAHWYLALALELDGRFEEAEAEFEIAAKTEENPPIKADAAHFYASSGRPERARELLEELERSADKMNAPFFGIALAYIALDDKNRAIEFLEKAFLERSDMLVYLAVEPRLDPIRDDPGFKSLMARVGF